MSDVAAWIRNAEKITVLSGAGMSAESGVPTFRGDGGLWRQRGALELANAEAFERDPKGVWAWYRWRQDHTRRCVPNAGHLALAALERARPGQVLIATQNVDGLHRRAGSERVIELHGNLFADRCTRCGQVHPCDDGPVTSPVTPEDGARDPELVRCTRCQGLLRPGVVWFGEHLPAGALETATAAAEEADVLLVVGTSGVVMPAAGLARVTREHGGRVVVINTEHTDLVRAGDVELLGGAAVVLPELVAGAGIALA